MGRKIKELARDRERDEMTTETTYAMHACMRYVNATVYIRTHAVVGSGRIKSG